MTGAGTLTNPYIVETLADLQAITDDPTAHYKLGGDIDASDTASWHEGKGFIPIGLRDIEDAYDIPISVLGSSGSWTGLPEATPTLFHKNVDRPDDVGSYKIQYIASYLQAAAAAEIIFGVTHPEDELLPSPCVIYDVTVEGYGIAIGGTAKYKAVLRVGGTDYYGTERTVTRTTQFTRLFDYWDTNPKTGMDWTRDEILGIGLNAVEGIGIQITSGTLKVCYLYWMPSYNITFPDDIYFTGSLDGNNHVIDGLTICRPYQSSALILSLDTSSEVKDLRLENVDIVAGGWGAGALACDAYESILNNCHSSGSVVAYNAIRCGGLIGAIYYGLTEESSSSCYVNGNGADAGGFVGFAMDTIVRTEPMISKCFATGQVDSLYTPDRFQDAGGFVGSIQDAILEQCYATGNVFARGCPYESLGDYGRMGVGGFIGAHFYGYLSTVGGETRDCFARGAVSYENIAVSGQGEYIGGFSGYGGTTGHGVMENCYSTGLVTGVSKHGFCGGYYSLPTIEDCFWDTETSGCADSHGGTGKTTAQMKMQSTFTNWDFDTIWAILATYNDGYPYLMALTPKPIAGVIGTISAAETAATLLGKIIDDVGSPCEWRFRYRKGEGSYLYTAWANGKVTDDTFSKNITGLTLATQYEFAVQARNLIEGEWSASKYFMTLSARKTAPVEDKISLELIRNIEMAAQGRFYTDAEGNAVYKSRYGRNT